MLILKLLCINIFLNCVICFPNFYNIGNKTKSPSPLILIPGDGGSRAYGTVTYLFIRLTRLLWVNYEYMLIPSALTSDFKLIYDPKSHTTRDVDDVKVFFPGWGSTLTIEELDEYIHSTTTYFAPLVKELLKDKFYQRNRTLRGAPYDFRKAPNENLPFVNDMRQLVEDTYNQSGQERVVLLGHSMGSSYSLYFLKRMSLSWKKKYIRSFVSVSGPLAGAVKTLVLETTGDSLGSPRNPYDFREMQRSFPSTAFLMPQHRVFGDTPIIITPKKNYSSSNYEELFKDMHFPFGTMMYKDTLDLVDGFKPPEGIDEIYCIYGYNRSTTEQLVFTDFPNTLPVLKTGDGDGTVNIKSLEVCNQWPNVQITRIEGAEHMKIVSDPQFMSKLKAILYKQPNLRF